MTQTTKKTGLNERLGAQLDADAAPQKAKDAFRRESDDYTKRLTLDLTEEQHRALKLLGVETGITMVKLMRGAIQEMVDDPTLLERVVERTS